MVFLNGNKTSGFVKLLPHIQVTCLILLLQIQRDKQCAKRQWSRGEWSTVRRWVGRWCWRENVTVAVNLEVLVFLF